MTPPKRKRKIQQPIDPVWKQSGGVWRAVPNTFGAVHGKRSTYIYRGCRCEPCCKADQEYRDWYRKERRPQLKRTPDDMKRNQHGTSNGYIHYNCRCRPCTDAVVAYRKAHADKRKKENGS